MFSRAFSLTHTVCKQAINNLYYFLTEQLSCKQSLRETPKDLHDRQTDLYEQGWMESYRKSIQSAYASHS